jgi:hypothetical protein
MKVTPTENDIYIDKNFFKKKIPIESRKSAMTDFFLILKNIGKCHFA